jgi:hypothetical protein
METQIVMTHESHDPEIKEMSKEWKCLPEKLLLPFYDCLMTTSLARKSMTEGYSCALSTKLQIEIVENLLKVNCFWKTMHLLVKIQKCHF